MNSNLTNKVWILHSNNYPNKTKCNSNLYLKSRSLSLLLSKLKHSTRNRLWMQKTTTEMRLKLKNQRALMLVIKLQELNKISNGSQTKSTTCYRAINNSKRAIKVCLKVRKQSPSTMIKKRWIKLESNSFKVKSKIYRKQIQTWWAEMLLCKTKLNN